MVLAAPRVSYRHDRWTRACLAFAREFDEVFAVVDELMGETDVPDFVVCVPFVLGGVPRTLVLGAVAAYRAFVSEPAPRDRRGRFTKRRRSG